MSTILTYLDHMHELTAAASVIDVRIENGRTIVCLDQTILYPQGGGQPYDTGHINSDSASFLAEEVRFVDGDVLHIGQFEHGRFQIGELVRIEVDAERRQLNSRLHSAGHLVDMALNELDKDWLPSKGYHFPDSPYIEYVGQLDLTERSGLMAEIERLGNVYIKQDLPVSCRFVTSEELTILCRHIPSNLPTNKPIRVVQFANFALPCGGTHVRSLAEITNVHITKLKQKADHVTVGYQISR